MGMNFFLSLRHGFGVDLDLGQLHNLVHEDFPDGQRILRVNVSLHIRTYVLVRSSSLSVSFCLRRTTFWTRQAS